jgi:DNA processing protein
MIENEAFAILASISHLGSIKIRFLLQTFGSAVDALKASTEQISALPGFDRIVPNWTRWQKDKLWERDLALAAKYNVQLIPFTSPQFPKTLLAIADHPALLYVRGSLKPQDQRSIAVVGTRQASIYGCEMAKNLSKDLAAHGFTVVSGLARGIDTAAHRGALLAGRTLAVIGSGLADIYPPENHQLAESIIHQGALISEFPMATPPDRQNFPQRNRIVSGMSMAALLIEAPVKSGAMITMEKAHLQERKLFALPGRADNENFRGNHLLIKNGKAHLIETAADILVHFQDLFSLEPIKALDAQHPLLDNEEKSLLDKMPGEEVSIEELVPIAALPIHSIHRILMSLVLKKAVKEFHGKIYKKLDLGSKRHINTVSFRSN